METEEYSLNWKCHAEHLQKSFIRLLENNHLCDVTLHAERQQTGAHKLILSSCSEYFNEIFKEIKDEHPHIILKGVSFDILQKILKFIYYGQVTIKMDKLSEFLEIANFFNINGLIKNNFKRKRTNSSVSETDSACNTTEMNFKSSNAKNDSFNIFNKTKITDSFSKLQEKTNEPKTSKKKFIIGDKLIPSYKKHKVRSSPNLQDIKESESYEKDEDFGDSIDAELDLLSDAEDDYSMEKELLKTHLATETEEGFRCNICNKTYIKKDLLKKHFSVHCKNNTCIICGLTLSRRAHLKRHIMLIHKK